MRTKQYPSQDRIKEILSYKEGKLYWKKDCKNKMKTGDEAGYKMPSGYRIVWIDNNHYYEHRIIWIMHNGDIPVGLEIDHINLVKNDNRLNNLRLATKSQNTRNKVSKNVYFRKDRSQYEAYFNIHGKRTTKCFKSQEEAESWIEENKPKI